MFFFNVEGTLPMRMPKIVLAALAAASLALAACAPQDVTQTPADNKPASSQPATTTETTPAEGESTPAEPADTTPVKVGIIYSKTGPLAAYGETFYQGFLAGLDYATDGTNAVNGRPLEITYTDDAGNPDKAVSAAKEAIANGTKIIGGTVVSGVALTLAEQAAQNQVLYISGPAATDGLQGINKYTFRSGRQSLQDVAAGAAFVDSGQKVLVFAQDNAFGQGNVAAVKAVFGAKGVEVSELLVPEEATDFIPFARQIIEAKPDAVFVAWAGATSGAMWQGLTQQGVFDSTKVITGLGDISTYNAFGEASANISFLNHYFAGAADNDVNKALIERLDAGGHAADLFSPDGFVAAQMVVRAVEAGGDDVDAMIAGLEGWEFEGPKGKQTIRASDHVMVQPMFHAKLVQDGSEWKPELVDTVSAEDAAPAEAP
ncbi:MAG: substrate-binding domain-containing protein [Propionibacteriaceae bacterium]|nr:substrate-binding domain-containing protein [Propionibacteriaceae bacterium]